MATIFDMIPGMGALGDAQPSASPTPAPRRPGPNIAQPNDPLTPLFAALARAIMAQQANAGSRLQLQRDQTFGQHLGTGGAPVTPDNPLGYAGGSPFDNGFFTSGARDLTPEQRMRSQGATAVNQWQRPDLFAGSAPPVQTAGEAAVGASAPMFHLDPSTLDMAGLPPSPYALGDAPRPPRGGMFPASAGTPPKRKGSDFSFSGSPRPGFGFGAGMRR